MVSKVYIILGFLASILCLVFAFRGIEWAQLVSGFGRASLWGLALSLFFHLVSLAVAGIRWKTVIHLREVSWASVSSSLMIGLMVNNIFPGRMGEVARPIVLAQESKQSKAFLFATAVTDRLFDLLVLVILALLCFGIFPLLPWAKQMSFIGGAVLVAAFGCIGIFGYSKVGSRVEKTISRFTGNRFFTRVNDTLRELRLGFRSIESIPRGIAVFGLTWGVWVAWFLSLYYGLNAFALTVPLGGILLLLCVLNLAGLIPSSPGYTGTYHLLAVLVLSVFSVKREDALSFILVFHALWYIPQTLLGFILLARKNLTMRRVIGREEYLLYKKTRNSW